MASFRDPRGHSKPIEVIERLLEITDYLGHEPVLYLFVKQRPGNISGLVWL